MQLSLTQALLVLVFRSARLNRRPNLTRFCRRNGASLPELESALSRLVEQGLLVLGSRGEQLSMQGLALAAALAKRKSEQYRPVTSCRGLAA